MKNGMDSNMIIKICVLLIMILIGCNNFSNATHNTKQNCSLDKEAKMRTMLESIRSAMVNYAKGNSKYGELIESSIRGDIAICGKNISIGKWRCNIEGQTLKYMLIGGRMWGTEYAAKFRVGSQNEYIVDEITEREVEFVNPMPE